MTMIDATKWDEFYQEMTKDLKPYDHYDDGYRDAMDNADDWMDGNQVEAEPVRHGRWVEIKGMAPPEYHGKHRCSLCYARALERKMHEELSNYCPNCGAKMDANRVEMHTVKHGTDGDSHD